MTEQSNRDRKQELKRAFKQREREAAEAQLPLAKAQLAALFDYLDERLEADGCDHTLRHTDLFLRAGGIEPAPVLAWLRKSGGHCDCEVLANVESEWDGRL